MQIDNISRKVKKNIGLIKHVRSCVPNESLILLYKTIVEPYFWYCNPAWGKCGQDLLNKLQSLQNRAARVLTGVTFEKADHIKLLTSLGWLSVRQQIGFDIRSLVYKINGDIASEKTE